MEQREHGDRRCGRPIRALQQCGRGGEEKREGEKGEGEKGEEKREGEKGGGEGTGGGEGGVLAEGSSLKIPPTAHTFSTVIVLSLVLSLVLS